MDRQRGCGVGVCVLYGGCAGGRGAQFSWWHPAGTNRWPGGGAPARGIQNNLSPPKWVTWFPIMLFNHAYRDGEGKGRGRREFAGGGDGVEWHGPRTKPSCRWVIYYSFKLFGCITNLAFEKILQLSIIIIIFLGAKQELPFERTNLDMRPCVNYCSSAGVWNKHWNRMNYE